MKRICLPLYFAQILIMDDTQLTEMNESNKNYKNITSVAPSKKNVAQKTFGFINRNSLITAFALGSFAAVLTGKILTAPKGYESEQWMDEK